MGYDENGDGSDCVGAGGGGGGGMGLNVDVVGIVGVGIYDNYNDSDGNEYNDHVDIGLCHLLHSLLFRDDIDFNALIKRFKIRGEGHQAIKF